MKKTSKTLKILLLIAVLVCSACAVACGGSKKVTLSFETFGGEQIAAVKVEKNTEYNLPEPKQEGFKFEGWYLNEDLSGTSVKKVLVDQKMTVYAKWKQLYKVNFTLNGGTLSIAEQLYLEDGDTIYEAIKDMVPEKSGYTFGAWYYNGAALAQDAVMPKEDITLEAKYNVGYSVELWGEKMEGEGYELVKTVTGEAIIGEEYVANQTLAGYNRVANNAQVASKVLTENAAENVLKLYFDRKEVTVSFEANYPDGTIVDPKDFTVRYGESVEMISDFSFEGYCLAGWSTSFYGDVEYKAGYIESLLFNKKGEFVPDTITPDDDTVLYAVWIKAYVDMFGGRDYIYVLDEEGDVAYLNRGGVFFQGKYRPAAKRFEFTEMEDHNGIIEGKINEDGTYTYYSEAREGTFATLFVAGKGVVENTTIYFDAYNGIKYSVKDEEGLTTQSEGTYLIDKEKGYYEAVFTTGQLAGQEMVFILVQAAVNNQYIKCFQVRNEDERAMGSIIRFGVYENELVTYKIYDITLNGLGVANFNTGTGNVTYNYVKIDDVIYLYTAQNQSAGVLKIVTINGETGYMLYDETLDFSATNENGDTLVLDGMYEATYTSNNKTIKGYYATTISNLAETIVTFVADSVTYTFLVDSNEVEVEEEVDNGEGGVEVITKKVVVHTFETKPQGYTEYICTDGQYIYFSFVIVKNEVIDNETVTVLYGYNPTTKEYVAVSIGNLVQDEVTGRFVYTPTKTFEVEGVTEFATNNYPDNEVDITNLLKAEVIIDEVSLTRPVLYMYSCQEVGGEPVNFYDVYTAVEGGATITFVENIAIYVDGTQVIQGAYQQAENYMVIDGLDSFICFDSEAKTFYLLKELPSYVYEYKETGEVNSSVYIYFDGLGNATYTIETKDAENNVTKTEYAGKVETTGELTRYNAEIMQFTSEEKTFRYIMLSQGNTRIFAAYNEEYSEQYVADGILYLDGFNFNATYTTKENVKYDGQYVIQSENVIRFTGKDANNKSMVFYFDMLADRKFTVRGQEYGTYVVMDNQNVNGVYFEFNGYGVLRAFTTERGEGNKLVEKDIDVAGTYTIGEEDVYVKYQDGAKVIEYYGTFNYMSTEDGYIPLYVVHYEEIATTFVNTANWTVIELMSNGNAVNHRVDGTIEQGTYIIITGEMLYYVNNAGDDACIYIFDVENNTATPIKFNPFGYYTSELESLLFTEYGFAIFNGETRYYYNVVDGEAYIYRRANENETPNEYGFIEEHFGAFTDSKKYNENEYIMTSGYAVEFNRQEEGKALYPINIGTAEEPKMVSIEKIVFSPSGKATFNQSAQVIIDGNPYNATVVRQLNEENVMETYLEIANYRFALKLTYAGENEQGDSLSSYKVTGLTRVITALSKDYLDTYIKFYMYFGASIANTMPNMWGTVSINYLYNEQGEEVSKYFEGVFGEGCPLYDSNDELTTTIKGDFRIENNRYIVEHVAKDGYTYRMYVAFSTHQYTGVTCFSMNYVREQTFELDNGIKVVVERMVALDDNTGAIWNVRLYKDGVELETQEIYIVNGTIRFIVRTTDDSLNITSTTYYHITFTEKELPGGSIGGEGSVEGDDGLGEGEEAPVNSTAPLYESVTVVEEVVETIYNAAGNSYADIGADNVWLIYIQGRMYLIKSSNYDAATNTWTVVTTADVTYTVKVVVEEGVKHVEIQKVETPAA